MDAQTINQFAAWGGAIIGGLVGLLGGAIGCYFSIKNTKGPRERAFVIKACVVCWLVVIAFVIGMGLLPGVYKAVLVVPYVIALVAGVRFWNKRQAQIRAEEARDGNNPSAAPAQ